MQAPSPIIYVTQTMDPLPVHSMPDGSIRFLGSIPGKPSIKATPFASSGNPVIPRSDWKPFNRHPLDVKIKDQLQEGSCVANGWVAMLERARSALGLDNTPLSRAFLYALINGGRDAGADPADAADALIAHGVCTEATVPYRFLVQSQLSRAAIAEALDYKIEAASVVSYASFDELVSGEIAGYKSGVTVLVAGDWNTLDRNLCPPCYRGSGNHWVSLGDGLYLGSDGNWYHDTRQSWGLSFGDQGYFRLSEKHYDSQPDTQAYGIKWADPAAADANLIPVAA